MASPTTLPSFSSESTFIIDSPLLEYSICQILVGDIEKNDSVSFLHCNVITENWSINYETSWILYFFACIAVHFKGVTMMHFPRNIYENGSFCKDQGLVKTYGLSKVLKSKTCIFCPMIFFLVFLLKSVHFKKTVAQSSFLSKLW